MATRDQPQGASVPSVALAEGTDRVGYSMALCCVYRITFLDEHSVNQQNIQEVSSTLDRP